MAILFNIDDKAELERKNREKAYEVMYQQEWMNLIVKLKIFDIIDVEYQKS